MALTGALREYADTIIGARGRPYLTWPQDQAGGRVCESGPSRLWKNSTQSLEHHNSKTSSFLVIFFLISKIEKNKKKNVVTLRGTADHCAC